MGFFTAEDAESFAEGRRGKRWVAQGSFGLLRILLLDKLKIKTVREKM